MVYDYNIKKIIKTKIITDQIQTFLKVSNSLKCLSAQGTINMQWFIYKPKF